jgi:hypothetical protein
MRGGYKRQKEVSTLKNNQHRVSISVRPFALFVIRHRQPQRDPQTPLPKTKTKKQDLLRRCGCLRAPVFRRDNYIAASPNAWRA